MTWESIKLNSDRVIIFRNLGDDIEIINDFARENIHLEKEARRYLAQKSREGMIFLFYHSTGIYRCVGSKSIGVCMDITDISEDLEKTRKDLKIAKNKLEEIQKLFDLVIHDIKNHMFIMDGMLEMVDSKGLKDDILKDLRSVLEKMRETIMKSSILLRDRSKIKYVEIDMDRMIGEIVSRMQYSMNKKGIKCVVNCQVGTVLTDPLIEAAIVNIIDNAIRYTPNGGEIRIQCSRDNSHIILKVSDTGPGIPDGMKEEIFRRFKGTDTVHGMGLGLAITKHVVEILNGEIWIEDNKPHGAVFVIKLPEK